jgi:hypothetical protein
MTTTARDRLLAELRAGEDPTAEEYPDAAARLEGLVDAAIAEGIADTRTAAFNEAISRFNSLANLAPDSHRAPGINFAIGALMAMRDHPLATAPCTCRAETVHQKGCLR